MDKKIAVATIEAVYTLAFQRSPGERELEHWAGALQDGRPVSRVLEQIAGSDEFLARHRLTTFARNGHFHSPVVDPAAVKEYYDREIKTDSYSLRGIDIDEVAIREELQQLAAVLVTTDIADTKSPDRRFHFQNGYFPFGDAAVLRAILGVHRPRRVVEIGSGYSTVCILDAIDEFGLETALTCIEPFPQRLKSLLWPGDPSKIRVVEAMAQEINLSEFERLEDGDILFVDSTHVLKTGSDVHFVLFHILPRLRKGVFIHFHDCPYPFEYPRNWVFEQNMSWNEAYAIRAMLLYNSNFSITFWLTFLIKKYVDEVRKVLPKLCDTPYGSGLWIRRVAD